MKKRGIDEGYNINDSSKMGTVNSSVYIGNDTSKLPQFNPGKMAVINRSAVESNDGLTMALLSGGTYVSYLMSEISGAKYQSREFATLTKGALDSRLNQLTDKPFREYRYGGSNSIQAINLEELKAPSAKSKPSYEYDTTYAPKTEKRGTDSLATTVYNAIKSREIQAIEYNPLEKELSPQQTLETLAYSAIANIHSNQPKTDAKTYIVADPNYTITLSEGYVKQLDLRYLTLNVKSEEEEKTYQILIKAKKELDIKADLETAKALEDLLKKLTKKQKIDEKEIAGLLAETAKRKHLSLTEEEIETIRKTTNIKAIKTIFFSDKDRLKKIEINKTPSKYYKKPASIIDYPAQKRYLQNLEKTRKDFTNIVPAKNVHKFPVSMMGGILGFTYLGDSFIGIRDDLNDYESHEVEIHEAIHTPDEYETRQIVRWMLDNETKYH